MQGHELHYDLMTEMIKAMHPENILYRTTYSPNGKDRVECRNPLPPCNVVWLKYSWVFC